MQLRPWSAKKSAVLYGAGYVVADVAKATPVIDEPLAVGHVSPATTWALWE